MEDKIYLRLATTDRGRVRVVDQHGREVQNIVALSAEVADVTEVRMAFIATGSDGLVIGSAQEEA